MTKEEFTDRFEPLTAGGYPWRVLATDLRGNDQVVIAISSADAVGTETVFVMSADGFFMKDHDYNLIPKTRIPEWEYRMLPPLAIDELREAAKPFMVWLAENNVKSPATVSKSDVTIKLNHSSKELTVHL